MKQLVQQRPGRLRRRRDAVGLFDLAEDLRLADHQRIEPRRHAEEMTRGVVIDVRVEVRPDLRPAGSWWNSEINASRSSPACARILARDVELGAIARRDDDRLRGDATFGERATGVIESAAAKSSRSRSSTAPCGDWRPPAQKVAFAFGTLPGIAVSSSRDSR